MPINVISFFPKPCLSLVLALPWQNILVYFNGFKTFFTSCTKVCWGFIFYTTTSHFKFLKVEIVGWHPINDFLNERWLITVRTNNLHATKLSSPTDKQSGEKCGDSPIWGGGRTDHNFVATLRSHGHTPRTISSLGQA